MHRATVRIDVASPDAASALARALRPDGEGYLTVTVDGPRVRLEAEAGSVMGLLRTLDDALAAVQGADVAGLDDRRFG